MRTGVPFRVKISKMKKSASSIIKVSAIFMFIFHKIHFWKGTAHSSEGISQPTHSRYLAGIFSAHSELKFFSNITEQGKKGRLRGRHLHSSGIRVLSATPHFLCGVKQGIRHLFTRYVRTLRNKEKLKRWQML
jgi:hypothetical protein